MKNATFHNTNKWLLGCLLFFSFGLSSVSVSAQQAANCEPSDLLIVLDHSGSMASSNKWQDAVQALNTLLNAFGTKLQLGLIAFESKSQLYVSVGSNTATAIRSALSRLSPTGQTAMKCALQDAFNHYQSYVIPRDPIKDRRRFVVLITDGMPNQCGTDVVPAVAALRQVPVGGKMYDIKTFVIGFGSGVDAKQLQNMAVAGGTGQYYQANNLASLQQALDQIAKGASQEICDNKDNDCDGKVDDFSETCQGQCGQGTRYCKAGQWSQCSAQKQPSPEVCNNLDDDCNGKIDDGLKRSCSNACGQGTEICTNGKWENCTAPKPEKEICNGKDDNCNGQVDEGVSRECSTACGKGTQACIQGDWSTCSAAQPIAEICDGKDNDCNGQVDDGALADCDGSCLKGVCYPKCRNGECLGGRICEQGVCVPRPCQPVCTAGQVCRAGKCVSDDCNQPGSACETNQICQNQKCIPDPCRGVQCAADQFCKDGQCRHSCEKVACAADSECRSGVCVPKPCAGKCQNGQSCVADKCVPNTCSTCTATQVCQGNQCVDNPCNHLTCPKGQRCLEGECYGSNGPQPPPPPADGGSNNTNSNGNTDPGHQNNTSPGNNANGSTVPGNNSTDPNQNTNGAGNNTGGGGRAGKGGCLCDIQAVSLDMIPVALLLFLLLVPFVLRRSS